MSDPLRLLPPRVPLTDPRTGLMARDWYLFFQQLYDRVGGANAPSNDDLAGDLFEDAGSGEVVAALYALTDAAGQEPQRADPLWPDDQTPPVTLPLCLDDQGAELSALRAQVAELTKDLEGAQSGINELSTALAELLKEIDAIKQATIGGQP